MHDSRRDDGLDLYEILEVSPRASQDVIQAAYRVLARTAHPDRNPAPDAESRIRQINAAYEVLGDPAQRARYDLEALRARRRERQAQTIDVGSAPKAAGRPPGAGRGGVVQMRPVPRAKPIEVQRFPILNLQAVVLLFAMGAFTLVMLLVLWMGFETLFGDEKMPTVGEQAITRFEAPPAYVQPLLSEPRR